MSYKTFFSTVSYLIIVKINETKSENSNYAARAFHNLNLRQTA